jgi:hypothetical protein
MERWLFVVEPFGKWRWQTEDAAGNVTGKSLRRFPTRAACIRDAVQRGYVDQGIDHLLTSRASYGGELRRPPG